MRRTNLYKATGLPIFFNDDMTIDINGLVYTDLKTFYLEDLRSQLLNPNLKGDLRIYSLLESIDNNDIYKRKNISISLITVYPVIVGIEYAKTHGFKFSENPVLLDVAYGRGRIILQKVVSRFENEVIVSPLSKGKKIIVPPGYSFKIVNTGKSPLLIVEIGGLNRDRSLSHLDEMQGMGYYIIRKNCKHEIVRNPHYRLAGNYGNVDWDLVLKKFNISIKTPIVKQTIRKYEKFSWLFTSEFDWSSFSFK